MWNISEIKLKQKYVLHLLNDCNNDNEEDLLFSYISYILMLENSGTFLNTLVPNILDFISLNLYSSKKYWEIDQIENYLYNRTKTYMSNDFLAFLIEVCKNVSKCYVSKFDSSLFIRTNESDQDVIHVVNDAIKDINDIKIYESAKRILDDSSAINFSNICRNNSKNLTGLTLFDFKYNKAYCSVNRYYDITDIQTLYHEVMHGVDFYYKKKYPSVNYYGFDEVVPYSFEYLLINYLENHSYSKKQLSLLKLQKDDFLKYVASNIYEELKNVFVNTDLDDIRGDSISCQVDSDIINELLFVLSGVISYGFGKQLLFDKELGLYNIKSFMKNIIPKDKDPNFDRYGLSRDYILELSKKIGEYSSDSYNVLTKKK